MNKSVHFLFFIAFIIVSCSESSNMDEVVKRQDHSYRIFNKAKQETDINKKLNLLALAAKKVKSTNDTLLFDIIDYQIYYHDINRSYDSSLYYSNLMINNATKFKDTASLAKGYYRKARIFLYLNKHEQVLRNMYQSQSLFQKVGDSSSAGKRLVELANAQDRLGDFIGSHNSATEA